MAGLIKLLAIFAAFFVVAGLLLVLGAVRSSSHNDAEAAIEEEIRDVPPAMNVTAGQLVRTYQANEDAVSAAYNGAVIIVEGPTGANKSANYLGLHSYEAWAVRCFASDEEIDKVKVLSRLKNRSLDNRRTGYVLTGRRGVSVSGSRPIFAFKGKIEGVNDKHLTIDLRGCTLQDST